MHKDTRLTMVACGLVCISAILLAACSGSQVVDLAAAGAAGSATQSPVASGDFVEPASWLAALPEDYRQPWEELDTAGFVIPAGVGSREASAINSDGEFVAGVERFSEAGDVSNLDQASNVGSGLVGMNDVSHAVYRLSMGAAQPGTVSVDINLHAKNDGSLSEYWLGISDYAAAEWLWRGPFSDSHVRLSLAPSDYTSGLGNTFVAVVAHDGSAFDVVGVGANLRDEFDLTAPPAPDAPVITPVTGGVLLVWLPVIASDLAGYRIYYSTQPFTAINSTGVKHLDSLDGSRRIVLPAQGQVYVRLTAVDFSGNESDLSLQADAAALAGDPLEVILTTDLVSGVLGDTANLTATGGDSYDFDLDGDGIFEVTGDLTGSAAVVTSNTGIIRPRVRASSGGSAKALGAVSLVIAAKMPPVAMVTATPNEGVLWRAPEVVSVTFDASDSYDQDSPSLEYAFDPMGDGTYSVWAASDSFNFNYSTSGTYLAAVKVKDGDNLIAHSSTLVKVRQVAGFHARNIDRFNGKGQFSSMAIVDGKPAIAMFDSTSAFLMYVRATDAGGNLWGEPIVIDNTLNSGFFTSLQVIAGNPAVSYYASGANEVRYLRADDPQGSAWTNTPVVIDGPVILGTATSLAYVDGNPAIAYDDAGANTLKYRRATSGAGTGDTAADWADAPLTLDASGDVGGYANLKVISGNPAIAYWDSNNQEALYRRAVNSTGATAGNWPVAAARASPAGVTVGGYVSLLQVNGRPAVCFFETSIGSLQYIRASTSSGAVTADWPLVTIQVASGGADGQFNSLALINGRPAISYIQTTPWVGLMYSRATDSNGATWQPPVIVKSAPAEPVGFYSSLVDIDDLPAISYWNLAFSTIGFASPILN